MATKMSRAELLEKNPNAKAVAALQDATNAQQEMTPGAIKLTPGKYAGKTAVILGSGVAGLTTAYELLAQKSGMNVIVLEAQNRTGGRCLTLRTGDTLTEDKNSDLFTSAPGETQVVRFKKPLGDAEPYLNAGPGRIPSAHKRLLNYLKKFGVDIEVYVMNSESNLVRMEDGVLSDKPYVYRRLNHNTRGWIAQMVYQNAKALIESTGCQIKPDDIDERTDQLKRLMISFGELDKDGNYVVNAGEDGLENGKTRQGYRILPGVHAGETGKAIDLDDLLSSEFWRRTKFYQPSDFLWQPTLFQPVGGMDQVQHAFAQQVAALGGVIHLNSPVTKIKWSEQTSQFEIHYDRVGANKPDPIIADYCFSNIAIPFLKELVEEQLQNPEVSDQGFSNDFKAALDAVYVVQFSDKIKECEDGKWVEKPRTASKKFQACTTKVGWQADRKLWQGGDMETFKHTQHQVETNDVPKSQVGVVPIFGGISWTEYDITQIWYPSNDYHDKKGVLTGAYNFGDIAAAWGETPINERLAQAKDEASKFGEDFGKGLHDGLAIAWQNMPYIKGGWAQWDTVEDPVHHFNKLTQATKITNSKGETTKDNVFFVIGDQLSSLPGWQEGAIASALNALNRLENDNIPVASLKALPDTKLMVEGV